MSRHNHLFVLGQSGLLGQSLCDRANVYDQTSGGQSQVHALDSRPFVGLIKGNCQDAITQHVAAAQDGQQDWVYACGDINPRSGSDHLFSINADLPSRLFQMLTEAAGQVSLPAGRVRLITFGSVLEERRAIADVNPYIASKARLFGHFGRRAQTSQPQVGWFHIRLHTLYGKRRPPPFMFLGQMEAALRSRTVFSMSAGSQLREYHHADDVADNVLHVLSAANPTHLITLTNGRPLTLSDLATQVFEHFGVPDLLRLGAVDAQPGEVFAANADRSAEVVADRDAIHGIISWFEDLGIQRARA